MSKKKLFKALILVSIPVFGTIGIIVILFFVYLLAARNQPTSSNNMASPTRLNEAYPIPGVISEDIVNQLEQKNLICSDYQPFRNGFFILTCEQKTTSIRFHISLFSNDLESVYLIDANYTQYEFPNEEQAIINLGQIARLPFEDTIAEDAFTWVVKTMPKLSAKPGDIKMTTVNGIKLKLYGLPEDRSLEIGEIP